MEQKRAEMVFASSRGPLQICLLHHTECDEWLLPKGHKDRGKCVPSTAMRETFEETRFPYRQAPAPARNGVTRAPAATAQTLSSLSVFNYGMHKEEGKGKSEFRGNEPVLGSSERESEHTFEEISGGTWCGL
jgi:ADP-ribose pyrophosphatase YjhB (NUDIX family)